MPALLVTPARALVQPSGQLPNTWLLVGLQACPLSFFAPLTPPLSFCWPPSSWAGGEDRAEGAWGLELDHPCS